MELFPDTYYIRYHTYKEYCYQWQQYIEGVSSIGIQVGKGSIVGLGYVSTSIHTRTYPPIPTIPYYSPPTIVQVLPLGMEVYTRDRYRQQGYTQPMESISIIVSYLSLLVTLLYLYLGSPSSFPTNIECRVYSSGCIVGMVPVGKVVYYRVGVHRVPAVAVIPWNVPGDIPYTNTWVPQRTYSLETTCYYTVPIFLE